MDIDKFKRAKFIREKINHMNLKIFQLEKMKQRENDDEFNLARELAHDAIEYSISRLVKDFDDI